jgi:NTP pyrophosphatase (non-canonical NTP hydrolase)
MELNEYQTGTQATAKKFSPVKMASKTRNQIHLLLSAATSTTEIAGKVKKNVFHQHNDFIEDRNFSSLKDYVEAVANRRIDVFVGELPLIPKQLSLLEGTLGMVDEAGEVAELVDRHVIQGKPVENFKEMITKELGDVMWYIAETAKAVDVNLEDVAQANIKKLEARYPGGFTPESSIGREEEKAIKDDEKELLLWEMKAMFESVLVDNAGIVSLQASENKIVAVQSCYNKLKDMLEEAK